MAVWFPLGSLSSRPAQIRLFIHKQTRSSLAKIGWNANYAVCQSSHNLCMLDLKKKCIYTFIYSLHQYNRCTENKQLFKLDKVGDKEGGRTRRSLLHRDAMDKMLNVP